MIRSTLSCKRAAIECHLVYTLCIPCVYLVCTLCVQEHIRYTYRILYLHIMYTAKATRVWPGSVPKPEVYSEEYFGAYIFKRKALVFKEGCDFVDHIRISTQVTDSIPWNRIFLQVKGYPSKIMPLIAS